MNSWQKKCQNSVRNSTIEPIAPRFTWVYIFLYICLPAQKASNSFYLQRCMLVSFTNFNVHILVFCYRIQLKHSKIESLQQSTLTYKKHSTQWHTNTSLENFQKGIFHWNNKRTNKKEFTNIWYLSRPSNFGVSIRWKNNKNEIRT